jgi:hypothetical protein
VTFEALWCLPSDGVVIDLYVDSKENRSRRRPTKGWPRNKLWAHLVYCILHELRFTPYP